MRVIHTFKDAYPPTVGGVELHVHDLAHSYGGVESTVLASSRSRRRWEDDDGMALVVRGREWARAWSTPVVPSWRRELRKRGADLLHVHMPNPFGELAVVAARPECPMVVSFHAEVTGSSPMARPYEALSTEVLGRAEWILVSSPVLAGSQPLARYRSRVVVVPYGVDPDEWGLDQKRVDEVRRRHPGPTVLFLGRLVHYKGVEVLIDAMLAIDATLLVVGDGPRRAWLEARARRRGLRSKVVFVGQVTNEERAAYYRAADVFVLPSRLPREAFGIAMLEAMSLGTPVVSTELGTGTSWVNRHGETGLVVPPADPAALGAAVRRVLGDGDLRRDLAAGAAERARCAFSKKVMLGLIGEVYRSSASCG